MSRALDVLRGGRRAMLVVVALVMAALAATGVAIAAGGDDGGDHHLTAFFTRTIGLYQGNDVRILGVKVGTIDELTVEGTKVQVEMTVDGQ
jgi:ABC-type transporter Mla subunit MlaD